MTQPDSIEAVVLRRLDMSNYMLAVGRERQFQTALAMTPNHRISLLMMIGRNQPHVAAGAASSAKETSMIELTDDQWQAVIREETPTAIDPGSQTAYIVVRKDEYDQLCAVRDCEANAAAVLRIAWMRRMELDDDEIAESLRDDPPTSVAAEMKQLKALDKLDKITPPADVLGKYAIQY